MATLKEQCNTLVQKIAVARGKWCIRCGTSWGLEGHHVAGRHKGTIHDTSTVICLCSKCHRTGPLAAHHSPKQFRAWYEGLNPNHFAECLEKKAKIIYGSIDYCIVRADLKAQLKALEGE